MYPKKATISTSQNLKSKLTLKETLFQNQQIHSQPQSSKGAERKKNDVPVQSNQDNCMKKKLHSLLGKAADGHHPFTVSPVHSQQQRYFVSASVQQISKNYIQKKPNHTENYDSHKTLKRNANKLLKPQKPKEFNRYYDFLENNNFEIQKQFGNFVRSVEKIQPEQIPHLQQVTDRSSLIALFEKLHQKDHENFNGRRQTLQDSDQNLFSLKQSIEEDRRQPRGKRPLSNNSSGQLCSHLHPNSTSTQLQQNPTSLVSVEQNKSPEESLSLVLEKSRQLLTQYAERLRQTEVEKQMLVQEVQYWKSRYFKSRPQQQ